MRLKSRGDSRRTLAVCDGHAVRHGRRAEPTRDDGDTRIGWIGIGRMGYAMAARLAKQGADLTVWNRTRAKAEPLAKHGAKIASALSELAACDIVFVHGVDLGRREAR